MRIRLTIATILLLMFPIAVHGQSLVDGLIVNGGPLAGAPNVTVHLVNNKFSPPVDKLAKTDETGYYHFDDVKAGEGYSVDVYSDTGKPLGYDLHFIVVDRQKYTTLPSIDIAKGVDATQENQSGNLLLNDRGVAQGANVSNFQLRELPLYNRTFLALALLQPGVHDVEQGSPLQGAGFSIAGSRPAATDFRLNSLSTPQSFGADNVASSNNQAIPFQVNEAIQDLRVVYAAPDVRYGQASGGVIDIVTSQSRRSKVEGWHGSAFGYFNQDSLNSGTPLSVYSNSGFFKASAFANSPLNAAGAPIYSSTNAINIPGSYSGYAPQSYNDLFSLLQTVLDPGAGTNLTRAGAFSPSAILASQDSHTFPITQSQFGFSAGRPLFGGKLLLFASYEGTIINNPTPIFERVPTALDTTLAGADGNIAKGILGLFPQANVGQVAAGAGSTASAPIAQTGTNAGVLGFYRGQAPNYTHVHNVHLRPDLPLSEIFGHKLGTLSLRYTGQLIDQLHDDTLPAGSAYPGNGAYRRGQNQSAAITHNLPFGNNANILSIGFTQFRVDEVAQDRGFNGASLGLGGGSLSTFVLSGIDTRTTGATATTAGLMGGWYDSFWNSCSTANNPCTNSTSSLSSPSPVTPSLDGDFPFARIGAPLAAPSAHRDTEADISDSLELTLGKRNILTLGGEYRYQQNFVFDGGLARGLVVANNIGEFTADSETCISCGRIPGGVQEAFLHPSFDYELRQPSPYVGDLRSSSFGLFAEHKFQPTDKFTLSAGVRYDYFGQPLDTQGRLWNYSQDAQGLVRQGSAGTYDAFNYQCTGAGTKTSLDSIYGPSRVNYPSGWNCVQNSTFNLPVNKGNVAGRLGFSFSPDEHNNTVLRAAVGGYYEHLPASYNAQLLKNRPSPYNVTNPSAIYGQNFNSAGCADAFTQCAFGLQTLNLGNEPSPSTFNNFQAASGANILYERDPKNLKTPYSIQFSGSIQRQLSLGWVAELAYVGSVNQRLPLIYDGNFTNEFYCTQSSLSSANPSALCNNNTFFPVFTESHFGASNYHSVIARVSSRQWHGLSLNTSYTYAKSLDDIAGSDFPQSTDAIWSQLFGRQLLGMGNPVAFALGARSLNAGNTPANGTNRGSQLGTAQARHALEVGGNIPSFNAVSSALTTTGSRGINVSHYNLPQNSLGFSSLAANAGGDYGRSDFDVTHRVVADFVYSLPAFGKKWMNGFLVTGVLTAQSGQPFSIFSGPAYGQVTQRVLLSTTSTIKTTGNPNAYISGVSPSNLLSGTPAATNTCPSLYAQGTLYNAAPPSPQACTGNSGRNSFIGPAFVSQDLALEKTTPIIHEGQSIVFRAEFFNLFNRANYYNPISEYSLDGVHVNPEFGLVRSAHDPRQIQLAVRYSF